MQLSNSILVSLALATSIGAQTLARGETVVNRAFSPVNTVYWYNWVLATPRGPALPALPGVAGTFATNLVGYLIYADVDAATSSASCEFRRTTDGGFSWSSPAQLFQDNAWSSEESVMVAEGHQVFVVAVRNNGTGLFVYGSQDQGQTWVSANVSPGMQAGAVAYRFGDNQVARYNNFAGGVRAALSGGELHLVYEAFDVPSNAFNEDVYYTSVRQTGAGIVTVNAEVRVNGGVVGASDCDFPRIDAVDPFVLVSWQEDNGLGDASNHVFSKFSLADGADLVGLPATQLTTYATPLPTITWGQESRLGIVGGLPYLVHTLEDSRTGTDAVHAHISTTLGATYATARVNQVAADVTEHKLVVEGSRIVVLHHAGTAIHAVVDDTQGAAILAGTATEVQVSAAGTNIGTGEDKLFALDMRGDVLATAYEANPGEQCLLGLSTDGGVSWREFPVSVGREVDEPYCQLTGNLDVLYSWIDNRACGSGNACNDTFVTGMKVPFLTDDPAAASLRLDLANGGIGGFGLLVISFNGTSPSPVNALGFAPNLDVFSNPSLAALLEIRAIAAPGAATFSALTASVRQQITALNLTAHLGVAILGGTYPNGYAYSDPVRVQ